MTFDSKNVLPMKDTVYVASITNASFNSRRLNDYELVGVHEHSTDFDKFLGNIPENAEAVVNYKYIPAMHESSRSHHQGLALILKSNR